MHAINNLTFKLVLFGGLALMSLGAASVSYAQEDKTPQRGFQPTGSYAISDIETINTVNGDLMLRVPLASLPAGRGGTPGYNIRMVYNSKLWDTVVDSYLALAPESGWRYEMGYEMQVIDRNADVGSPYACPDQRAEYKWKVKMTFPDGSRHEFAPQGYNGIDGYFQINPDGYVTNCSTGGQQVTTTVNYYSVDGSYIRLVVTQGTWVLYFPDGGRVTSATSQQPQRIYDRNNNYTEFQALTLPNGHPAQKIIDQLGRYILIEYDNALQQDYITSSGLGGTQIKWTVKWKTITVSKTYLNNGQAIFMTKTIKVVDQITPPSQSGLTNYIFGYNAGATSPSYGWGEVSSVTLPSGAQASYTYANDGMNTLGKSQILKNYPTRKDLTYQQEYDGTSTPVTETWSYSMGFNQNEITMPNGGVLRQYFNNSVYGPDWGQVFKEEQADGSLIERIWQQNIPYGGSSASTSVINPYVKTEFISIKSAAGTLVKTAIRDFNYDKNGNLTREASYDWVNYSSVPRDVNGRPSGIPAGAPLKKVVSNTYNSPTPDATDSATNDPDVYHQPTTKQLRNAIATSEVSSNGTLALARTEFFYDNATTTGNITQQKSWDSTKGVISRPLTATNSSSLSNQYDVYGNCTLMTDARGYQTQLIYGPVGGFSNLYPTQVNAAYTTSVQRTSNLVYDFYTGLVTQATDLDNNVATSTTYDVFGRPKLIKAAVGKPEETRTSMTYSDAGRYVIMHSDLSVLGDGKLVSIQHYDQLGRIRLTRQLEDATTQSETDETEGIKVQTRYRSASPYSYQLVSNPYRAATSGGASTETTMGWTATKRDSGGRIITAQSFSGATLPAPWGTNASTTGTVTTAYDSIYTTVTDQAGKKRRSVVDGLGRLIRVDEPDSTNNLGTADAPTQATSYTYDALSNLTQVAQGVQTRTFNYSSLSRLTSGVNPESGTISYLYDNNGNLTRATDARSIQANYTYDALNRVTSVNHSDTTSDVAYYYDMQTLPTGAPAFTRGPSEGRLVAVTYGGGSAGNYYGYDGLGQVLTHVQQTDGVNYVVNATYNKAGAMLTETYPLVPVATSSTDRRKISYSYDAAGRLSALSSLATSYAASASVSSVSYTARGALSSQTLGNNLTHTISYNSRLQATQIKLGTVAAPTSVLNLTYNYGTTANNGNVLDVSNVIGTSTTKQIYTYDSLNRLSTTQETNGSTTTYWSQTNGYDRYGNRWEVIAGSPTMTFNTQNKIVGRGYDAAGNLLEDGLHDYTYDAENRVITVDAASAYQYDGEGKRVRKLLGENLRFVYDMGGKLIAEFDATSGDVKKEYIYGADGLAATIEPTVGTTLGTRYTTSDRLGSPRVVTNTTGGVSGRHDYKPFGEELFAGSAGRTTAQGYVADGLRQKFTGYERDIESGLDYAQARYYSSTQGRFTTVDPFPDSGKPVNPATWNRFTYALNNPLRFTDPTGLDPQWLTDGRRYFSVPEDQYEFWINQMDENGMPIYAPVMAGTNIGVLSNVEGPSDFISSNRQLEGYEVILGADGNFQLANDSLYGAEFGQEMGRRAPALAQSMEVIAMVDVVLISAPIIAVEAAGGATTSLGLASREAGEYAVIGRLPTTYNYLGLPKVNILNLVRGTFPRWTPNINMGWIQRMISLRMPFLLSSPLSQRFNEKTGQLTQFGVEVQQLLDAGYRQVGQWLMPPP